MKLSKDKCIELILEQLALGSTYTHTLGLIRRNWTLSESSFKRYWNTANERYKEAQQAIKSSTEVQTITNELDKLKTLNLTKIDRMRIAESIAMGKAKRVEGQIVMPSPSDQLKALDYLSKIEGDYASIKQEVKINKIGIDDENYI